MGCVVKWAGESKLADIGINAPVREKHPSLWDFYVDGERKITLKGDNIATEFLAIVEEYVKTNYGENGSKRNPNKVILYSPYKTNAVLNCFQTTFVSLRFLIKTVKKHGSPRFDQSDHIL